MTKKELNGYIKKGVAIYIQDRKIIPIKIRCCAGIDVLVFELSGRKRIVDLIYITRNATT